MSTFQPLGPLVRKLDSSTGVLEAVLDNEGAPAPFVTWIYLTAAQIASPTAAILANTSAIYVRASYPFDTLRSNGTYLIPTTESQSFGDLTRYTDWFTNYMRRNATLLAPPARVTPFKPANRVYIDPSVVGPGTGTFGDPFKVWPAMAANTAYLLKEGETYLGALTVTLTNTISTPTVLGVYDAVTGLQITRGRGRATVSANSAVPSAITIAAGSAYVGVHGILVTGASNATGAGVRVVNDCQNIQILSVIADNYLGVGIVVLSSPGPAVNIVTEGCSAIACGNNGISYEGNGNHTGVVITYNDVSNQPSTKTGIIFGPYLATSRIIGGTIACNNASNCVTYGIRINAGCDDLEIYRNKCNGNTNGITVNAFDGTGSGAFTNLLVQNNECCNNEFGIALVRCTGSWTLEWNRLWRNGSLDDISAATVNNYGRGVEIVGTAATFNNLTSDGIVRFNSCCENYNFIANGTEGVGIGIDNFSSNIEVYGNYTARNQGSGLQLHHTFGTRMYANLCVDNMKLPSNLNGLTLGNIGNGQKADMSIGSNCASCDIFNNTIICGLNTNLVQKYGIGENSSTASKNNRWRNNLIYGAAIAGILKKASATTESTNAFEACAATVHDADTLAAVANGSGDVSGTWVLPPFYKLQLAASITSSGANIDATGMNPLQEELGSTPPIGAFKAIT